MRRARRCHQSTFIDGYRPSSDLHRAAELAVSNEESLAAYYRRRAMLDECIEDALRRVECGTSTASDAALLRAAIMSRSGQGENKRD
jgi:hypothetical protein